MSCLLTHVRGYEMSCRFAEDFRLPAALETHAYTMSIKTHSHHKASIALYGVRFVVCTLYCDPVIAIRQALLTTTPVMTVLA